MSVSTDTPAETAGETRRGRRGRGYNADAAGLGNTRASVFVAPAVLLIAVFLVFPAVWLLYLGLTNYALLGGDEFVGLDNYVDAVKNDRFPHSVWLTLQFVGASAVIGQAGLGFALAWMLRGGGTVKRLVEGVVVLSWILPSAVVGAMWVALLDGEGTLNSLFGMTGLSWLVEYPMLSIIVFNIWRGTAFSMMLYGAALGNVPPSHLETARLAGASGWQQLRDVVFPRIRGHILTNLLLITLWTFNDFTPFMLTKGSANGESEILPIYVYNVAIKDLEFGYGAAISTIILLINLVVAVIYLRTLRDRKAT